jgi:hypothetical protein
LAAETDSAPEFRRPRVQKEVLVVRLLVRIKVIVRFYVGGDHAQSLAGKMARRSVAGMEAVMEAAARGGGGQVSAERSNERSGEGYAVSACRA